MLGLGSRDLVGVLYLPAEDHAFGVHGDAVGLDAPRIQFSKLCKFVVNRLILCHQYSIGENDMHSLEEYEAVLADGSCFSLWKLHLPYTSYRL